ncbi:MAG: hypothetical protein WC549_00425 [Actinomycetota bacterium]
MVTYTERWGNLWQLFIKETYSERDKKFWVTKKEMFELDKKFERFLFKLNENLGIAG